MAFGIKADIRPSSDSEINPWNLHFAFDKDTFCTMDLLKSFVSNTSTDCIACLKKKLNIVALFRYSKDKSW